MVGGIRSGRGARPLPESIQIDISRSIKCLFVYFADFLEFPLRTRSLGDSAMTSRWFLSFLLLFSLLGFASVANAQTWSQAQTSCQNQMAVDQHNYPSFSFQCVDLGIVISTGVGKFQVKRSDGNYLEVFGYTAACTAGTTETNKQWQFGVYTASGTQICKPEHCQATFSEGSGDGVDVCLSIDPTLNATPDTFGTGSICFESGTMTNTGVLCNNSGGNPTVQPDKPPPDPVHCKQPKFANGQVPPSASAVCFKTDTHRFCTADGKYCVDVPTPDHPNTGSGGGSSGSSDPSRPGGDPPNGGGCQADSTGALCVGNPPPTPPPPPTGPGGNCLGGTTSWSVDGWSENTTAMENCPPPTTSCPAGTTMVNGQCSTGCPDGQVMTNGGCGAQCPAGQTLQDGSCNYVCPPGQSLSGNQCVGQCPSGTSMKNGVCVGVCPAGQVNNGSGCQSACGAGTSWSNGQCVATCPSGSTKDSSGICQPSSCPTGQVSSNGQCVTQCASNQHQDGTRCVDNNAANGGTDCTSPPVCTGDQALCNIDYQAWATRCAANPGNAADGDLSQMYTKSTDSVGSVMGRYQSQLSSSPLVHAADSFFTVNVGGSCPQLTIPAAEFMGKNIWAGLDGNFLCTGTVDTILGLASYVLLALAAFQAFRIALY